MPSALSHCRNEDTAPIQAAPRSRSPRIRARYQRDARDLPPRSAPRQSRRILHACEPQIMVNRSTVKRNSRRCDRCRKSPNDACRANGFMPQLASTCAATPTLRVGRLRRDRGISVARPTPLGNPFVVGKPFTRAEAIARYRDWIVGELERNSMALAHFERIVSAARSADVTLLCWCAPQACHADVIIELVRDRLAETK